VIIQVSRIDLYKGYDRHLEALARLKDNSEWTCWVVGGPQRSREERYFDKLKLKATRLGIADRVKFLGLRTDVSQLLAAADIFCQPNARPEAFGLVFVEALNARLPVVTTAFGGAVEVIDEACGILTAPDNVEDLSAALLKLIEDPILRRTLGAAGPRKAQEFCKLDTQLDKYESALMRFARARHSETVSETRDAEDKTTGMMMSGQAGAAK
jgi:glycosyltransferase involved in cell wall biosynthesis